MGIYKIKKGLNIPISGFPEDRVAPFSKKINSVATLGINYNYLKPLLQVKPGDSVKIGDVLFIDNKTNVKFTALGGGRIKAINRGEKRKLISVEIDLDENEARKNFSSLLAIGGGRNSVKSLNSDKVRKVLLETGLWASFRTRPFSKIPAAHNKPRSIFVTAIDTNPLAPNPETIINKNRQAFKLGLDVIAKIEHCPIHVCTALPGRKGESYLPHGESANIFFHFFEGQHPAGLVGTHIHHIDPITSINDEVWHIGYQDVIAIGKLFETGEVFLERYVALAGNGVKEARIIKVRKGVNLFDVCKDELHAGENRIISGSILSGDNASKPGYNYLGNFANIISVIPEDRRRYFHGFLAPGFNSFSVKPIFISKLLGKNKLFSFGTLLNGSQRDVVPIGSYEAVMPLDIEISYLVRSLLVGDTDTAEKLGALELDEEDLALVTFSCPGKNDLGLSLTNVLKEIDKDN